MSSTRESMPARQSCALAATAVPSRNARTVTAIRRGMQVSFAPKVPPGVARYKANASYRALAPIGRYFFLAVGFGLSELT